MNSSHANRKDIFYIIILILTFITVIVGAAFALYTFIFSQEEGANAVYTGTLSIEYLSGKIIDSYNLYPSEDPNLAEEKNIYKNNFRVTNTGSLDCKLEVGVEFYLNEFSNETLMYILYNSAQEEVASGYLEGKKTAILASNITLESNTTEDFNLVIWIKENGEDQNAEMKKRLNGTIRVDASQKIE